MLNRRNFLTSLTIAPLASASFPTQAFSQKTPDKIAISTWSFHNYFPNTRYGKPEFELAEWKLENVMEVAHAPIGISNFELSSAHLANLENDYLLGLKKLAKDKGYNYIHLSDNMKGVNLARADETKRAEDFKRFVELISVSEKLGIPLAIGVLSSSRTEAKIRLYERVFGAPAGVYFLYNAKTGLEKG